MSIKVKAKITRQVYADGEYRIFGCTLLEPNENIKLDKKYNNFTIVGDTPFLTEGQSYTLELEEKRNNRGTQYTVVSVPSFSMDSIKEITDDMELELLQEITSPNLAKVIHKAYPNYLRLILQGKDDEIDLNNIKGVKEYRHNAHIREINSKYKYYYILEINKQYGINIKDCKNLCTEYITVEQVNKSLEKNPYYCLTEICHHDFMKIDKVILKCRSDLTNSDIRTEAMCMYALKKNEENGNTYINAIDLGNYCGSIACNLVGQLKDVSIKSELIYYDENANTLSLMNTYLAECNIANFLKDKLKNNTELNIDCSKYEDLGGFKLSKNQTKALENFCKYDISILLGYAGTGKTSSMKALVSLLEDNNMTYSLLAPTGRASSKLSKDTGRPASTMHRAVSKGKISTDAIIVDEFSFFGTDWANMLITAIDNPDTKIIFVGDNAQLNPISHGKVFQDMIDSDIIPITMLSEVFRYKDGGIMKVGTDIRKGETFLKDKKTQEFGDDYIFIQTDNPADVLIEKYVSLIDKGVKVEDIMCLTPFNVGDEGTFELNNKIQMIINPPKPKEISHTYQVTKNKKKYTITLREGDYVINTVNDYKALPYDSYEIIEWDDNLTAEDVPLCSVFNGECGKIVSCYEDRIVVKFEEELIVYNKLKMYNLELGMVISTHKSQGSQSPYVIDVISPLHNNMHTRNLQYVATTRASKYFIEIGDANELNQCLPKEENKQRQTKLKDLLVE